MSFNMNVTWYYINLDSGCMEQFWYSWLVKYKIATLDGEEKKFIQTWSRGDAPCS